MTITVTDTIFGNNLLYLRKKYSLSRKGLAKLVGTAGVLIGKWETCQVFPTISEETLARLCLLFQISRQDLLHTPLSPQ